MDKSEFMRLQLASVGIFLDQKSAAIAPTPTPAAAEPEPVDRDEIRAILVDLGAPAKDLDWLTASCPGVMYALTYRPTIREAWCVLCGGVTIADVDGCVPCRTPARQFLRVARTGAR